MQEGSRSPGTKKFNSSMEKERKMLKSYSKSMSTGIARLTVVEAVLHKDTEFFGKMDPYFKIYYRNFIMTSRINFQGGKSPKWNETF
jgi:hypothetical protein